MIYLTLILALAGLDQTSVRHDLDAIELVSYADLDLGTPEGRSRLQQRIKAATTRVCSAQQDATPATYLDARCVRRALDQAQKKFQVGSAPTQVARSR